MSLKYKLIQEADSIAKEFLTRLDFGDKKKYLKAIAKAMPRNMENKLLQHLSIKLDGYGIKMLYVKHNANSKNKYTLSAVVDSFIRDLSKSSQPEAWKNLLKLRESKLIHDLSLYETIRIINECMSLKEEQSEQPLIFVLKLGDLMRDFRTIEFVRDLKSIIRICEHRLLVTSYSPFLMLFLGEVLTTEQYLVYDYVTKRYWLRSDSDYGPLVETGIFDSNANYKQSGTEFFFGKKPDDFHDYSTPWLDSPLEFAIIKANIGGNIILDISSTLNFRLLPWKIIFRNLTARERFILKSFFSQTDLTALYEHNQDSLKLRFGSFEGFIEFYLSHLNLKSFDLYVRRAENNAKTKINNCVLLPSNSITCIHVIGEEEEKDFLFYNNDREDDAFSLSIENLLKEERRFSMT